MTTALSGGSDGKYRQMNKKIQIKTDRATRTLRIGFVPLTDCAPIVLAQEFGLFKKHGLRVQLSRELGWATVRDKIVYGELDAAHALAAMPLAATLGLGSAPVECLTALILSLHGNAITLSNDLWKRGVRNGNSLRQVILEARREKMFTFGVVFPFSSHRHLLRRWLASHAIDPDRDVRIVVVPPPQMVAGMKAGHLDGFCVGEPWNSVAVRARGGWIAATSSELDPHHPEKVLMVRGDFAARRDGEHLALIAALREACELCDQPEHHERMIETLARPEFVGVSGDSLRHGITGDLDFGHGQQRAVRDFFVFNRDNANEPGGDKAAWVFNLIRATGLQAEPATIDFGLARAVFRADIFARAAARSHSLPNLLQYKTEHETTPA